MGKKQIYELTTEYIQNYILLLLNGDNSRQGLSTKTVQDTFSLVKRALRFASSQQIPLYCDFSMISISPLPPSFNVLTSHEQQTLITSLQTPTSLSEVGIMLALFTGIRIGELCALTWDNIHLNERYLEIKYTMQRIQNKTKKDGTKTKVVITKPKSNSSYRCIPLPEFLAFYLKSYQKSGNEFLLTGKINKYIEPRTLENHFKLTFKKLNIRDVNFHTLRHTFATCCVESGFDIKSLSEILGHFSVNITLNRYVHPSSELKKNQMEKLEPLFSHTAK